MARRISLEPHLTIEELEGHFRSTKDPVERSRWHFLWLLARGLTATVIASITGYSPELQPAEHLWPLTNTVLVNRHFASIETLEDVQVDRCVALLARPHLTARVALFHWWPKRIGKRQGPRAARRTSMPSRHGALD